jgi:hypothetical protein
MTYELSQVVNAVNQNTNLSNEDLATTRDHLIKALLDKNPNSTPEELAAECDRVIADCNTKIDGNNEQIAENDVQIDSYINNTLPAINNAIAALQSDNTARTNDIHNLYASISMQNEIKNILIPPVADIV